ncbi:coenzyme F420-0:L-glutamate ligase [Streptomyces sp. NBC_01465]|uniref:coenzyme F420-0:L-glutamate ligase n=1 Tax=Streptomyces sp. NBC_01465 TaxID=2903878 RepID=UPI002E33CBBF|nr:coenzyme F420-0:L-glutamate ligase [Streptomyces sp. NBC_01465]
MNTPTDAFTALALGPFPVIEPGDDLATAIIRVLAETEQHLQDGDILVVASKVVSISERRYVNLATVSPGEEALDLSARTGKSAEITQLILDESQGNFLATERGPIVAWHRLGFQLTSAGIDRAGTGGAWLLPSNDDVTGRGLRLAR